MEAKQNKYRFLVVKPEGIRPHLEDLRVDGRMMLKSILQKYDGGLGVERDSSGTG
jgi:hypothetical protein